MHNSLILDLNEAKMAKVAHELEALKIPVATFGCNVTDPDQVAQTFSGAVEQFGRIDYVFNNAGYQGVFAKTDEYPEEDFQKVIDINVVGVFHVLKAAAQHLRFEGGGAVVNMASHAGVVGPPNTIACSASKFAVKGEIPLSGKTPH